MPAPLATPALLDFAARALCRAWAASVSADHRLFSPERLAPEFLAAERSIVLRLLAALAREGRIPKDDQGSVWRVTLPATTAAGATTVDLPIARRGAFGLHDWHEAHADGLPSLHAVLAHLEHALDELRAPSNAARVERELKSSVIQLALARAASPARDALRRQSPEDPRSVDPEHWIVEGHPWHPMSRMRVGLSLAAALRHAPEQVACTSVVALEFPVDHVQHSPAWNDAIGQFLGEAPTTRAGAFVRLPVHVAQLRRIRADPSRAHLLADARVVDVVDGTPELVPGFGRVDVLPTRSLASLRTVDTNRGVHLKLALDVHTTSTRRIVSPMSVANGPVITRLLRGVMARDPRCRGFELMEEDSTAGLDPQRYGALAGEIGAILRPLPSRRAAWICAALGDRRPGSEDAPPGDSLLAEWSERHPGQTRAERVRALLDAYVDAFFPWSLRLLVVHGIALELHLQNVLAVLADDGRLACFRVRDLGGIRIHGPRLAAAGHGVTFAPGSFTVTDDAAEVRDKWQHTLLHAHFGTVFKWGEALGADAEESWARVRRRIDESLTAWAVEPDLSDAAHAAIVADHAALLAPQVRAKALLTMRLRQRSSDYDYVTVENALHDVSLADNRTRERR